MSDPASNTPTGQQRMMVNLSQLPLDMLGDVERQLSSEIDFLQESAAQMKGVGAKFASAINSVDSLDGMESGKTTLAPISDWAFIETKIVDSSYLLVKIGAGYYVEMNRDRARDYFQRKLNFVESQYKLVVEKILPEKSQARSAVSAVIKVKVRELATRQAA